MPSSLAGPPSRSSQARTIRLDGDWQNRVIGSGIVPRLAVFIIPENQGIAGIDGPRWASRRHPFDGVGSERLAVGVVGFAFRHFDMAAIAGTGLSLAGRRPWPSNMKQARRAGVRRTLRPKAVCGCIDPSKQKIGLCRLKAWYRRSDNG